MLYTKLTMYDIKFYHHHFSCRDRKDFCCFVSYDTGKSVRQSKGIAPGDKVRRTPTLCAPIKHTSYSKTELHDSLLDFGTIHLSLSSSPLVVSLTLP